MNQLEHQLLQRIQAFPFDSPETNFPFSYKLAWEYRWSLIYTLRTIEEYKKFVFLAMISESPVSPSSGVDRVWHAHLLCTQSYWEEFCGGILGRPLHHYPSLGGVLEGDKYRSQYQQTLNIYEKYFGRPPRDIWHPPRTRSEFTDFQWVNRQKYWLIPRFNLVQAIPVSTIRTFLKIIQ